ncbi:hypothetical protein PP353_gp40 [Arthrobacter phage Kumotta]|uniref:Uncharacterized protein n=1 Tax=Arthrobacter phage Kumotta TaxID=2588498 RepID=A0A4Y6ELF1_9CAUD|nr:hypothetical protein PP353_gp40 [Arthrobacter phage Kumotta]QDF19550.1 hypothetical protein SEA_KUMOTTA_40 [Arthrobacter phage Kumotta]
MTRHPRRLARPLIQRPAEGMPPGGWAAADLNLPALWYQLLARTATGCEYPISGDQQPENREAS